jgi:hypothetical protein
MPFVKRRSVRQCAPILIVALGASAFAAPTVAAPETPNEVTNWNKVAVEVLIAFPGPAGGAPPGAQIHMAMTQGAVYDAVNAITQTHEPYLLDETFDQGASLNAAATQAAYRVLTNIANSVPGSIAFPNKGTLLARLETEHDASLGAIADSQAKTDGIAAGNAAADAMIADRQGDGRFGPSQWDPDTSAGHWWPQARPDGSLILDPTPWAGTVDPFLMPTSSYFRTDGPQDLESHEWAEDYNEVKSLGRADSTTRTPDQTHIARFWQSTSVLTWNQVARDIVGSADHGVGVADSARLFAMLNLTAADSIINCWNDKYYFDFWRPWNAIPRGDEDGNPATEADTTWTPLIAAPYPDHPSGHLALDSAYLNVLQDFFDTDKIAYKAPTTVFPGEVREFDRFSDALKEIIDARIWAGLHYRTADIQSKILGSKVAHYMEKHYFEPLD